MMRCGVTIDILSIFLAVAVPTVGTVKASQYYTVINSNTVVFLFVNITIKEITEEKIKRKV